MLWHRIRGLWNTYHGILAVVLTLVFWSYLAIMSLVFKDSPTPDFQQFILCNLAAVAGLVFAALCGRSAATLLAGGFVESHTLALRQTAYVGLATLVVLLAAVDVTVSRVLSLSLLGGFLLVVYVVFLGCHLFVPKRLADHLFSADRVQRTLLIGPVDKARTIGKWIDETAAFGFGMRGSVTDGNDEESRILHVTRVSDVATLERIIANEGIKQIILLGVPPDQEALNVVVDAADKFGVYLDIVNDLPERLRHDITFFKIHGLNFISLRNHALEDPLSRILKRTLDLLVTLPILIVVLPPSCLVVMIFQAIQAPGPLFSRETRSGFRNRPFRSCSFRTLRMAREEAAANDERMYPMGRFLRNSGLDEMPQFLNVFFGRMSVVGPRPRKVIHNRKFSSVMNEYNVRTFAKPGVTGLAQISGFGDEARDDSDVNESAKLDIRYIENWSLPLDLWIICRAICQVISSPKLAP